eukprot:15365725-Ditylum_brightwellii.AAC.1
MECSAAASGAETMNITSLVCFWHTMTLLMKWCSNSSHHSFRQLNHCLKVLLISNWKVTYYLLSSCKATITDTERLHLVPQLPTLYVPSFSPKSTVPAVNSIPQSCLWQNAM